MGEVDVGQLEEDVRDNLDDLCYTEMKDLSKAVAEGVAHYVGGWWSACCCDRRSVVVGGGGGGGCGVCVCGWG